MSSFVFKSFGIILLIDTLFFSCFISLVNLVSRPRILKIRRFSLFSNKLKIAIALGVATLSFACSENIETEEKKVDVSPTVSDLEGQIDKQTGEFFIQVKVEDSDSLEDIVSVESKFFRPDSLMPYDSLSLLNDGLGADILPKDNLWSVAIPPAFTFKDIVFDPVEEIYITRFWEGKYAFEILATDKSGKNFLLQDSIFYTAGNPPEITSIFAPDTVRFLQFSEHTAEVIWSQDSTQFFDVDTLSLRFKATINDEEGLSNVKTAWITVEGTSGNPSPPISMDDSGDSFKGDEVAGDGVFTVTLSINKGNPTFNFPLVYYVIDKDGLASEPVLDTLVVINPFNFKPQKKYSGEIFE